MTAREVRFSGDVRERMLRGVDILANAMRITLGPKGRNVILERWYGAPRSTKDGFTPTIPMDAPVNQEVGKQVFDQAEKLFKDARVPENVQATAQRGVAASKEFYSRLQAPRRTARRR